MSRLISLSSRGRSGGAGPAVRRLLKSSLICFGLAVAVLLLGAAAWAGPADGHGQEEDYGPDTQGYVEGAQALEGRLLAPCCWNQTLDIHGSPASGQLRREIRKRLRAGESAEAIEADIVARYGERIRAVPPGSPLKNLAVWLSVAMGIAGIGAVWMLTRWRRRSRSDSADEAGATGKRATKKRKKGEPVDPDARDRYDDEIDAELERL